MATAQEHMLADFGAALDETGTELMIDSVAVLCFVSPQETMYAEYERTNLLRQDVYHLSGDLDNKSPGQIVDVDGTRWTVVSHVAARFSACLSLERSSG